MTKFVPKGPERYAHQRRGLNKMIQTGGVCALLYEPGTGKTATTLDYCSLLALKSPTLDGVKEARVLVVAPLAAIDTWVSQSEEFVSDQVNYWAEALGGSIRQRGEALASRGGSPLRKGADPVKQGVAKRALHAGRSAAWGARGDREIDRAEGPDGLGTEKPRLVIEVVNIDTFSSRQQVGNGTMADYMLDAVKRFSPDLMVVDESHKIKSASSNASRLIARVSQHVKRRVALTGTVMPTGPMDVFGQWKYLEPYAFGTYRPDGSQAKATFHGFRDRFAQMGGYMGREVVGYKNLDEMQDTMALNSIVAKKEEALDLPDTTDSTLKITMTMKEQRAYTDMKKSLASRLMTGELATVTNKLAQMMRLRQITAGHLPMDDGEVKDLGSSKAQAISSLVHDTLVGEKRIVIFCLFRHELKSLAKRVAQKGTRVEVISGDTSSEKRQEIRSLFGSDSDERIVLIAQIKTLSLAVNELVTASHAIFASLSQQRDDYIQARDRLNRIGQTRPVTFWHALVPGTLDEVILQAHQDRTNLESAVLKHILDQHEEE